MAAVVLPPVPNVARFAVSGVWQTHKWVNVFHLQYTTPPADGIAMNGVCQAVHTAYVNAIAGICSPDWVLQQVDGQDLASRTGPVGTFALQHAGGIASTSEPPVSVALCASWLIQDRYRGGHPRTYFAGLVNADITGGAQLTTAGQQKWLNAAAALLTDLNAIASPGGPWRMVCVRYFSSHQLLPNPLVRLVSGQKVHGRVDSMRRRTGKETP